MSSADTQIKILRELSGAAHLQAEIMAQASTIARTLGDHGLSNRCWEMHLHLKRKERMYTQEINKIMLPAA